MAHLNIQYSLPPHPRIGLLYPLFCICLRSSSSRILVDLKFKRGRLAESTPAPLLQLTSGPQLLLSFPCTILFRLLAPLAITSAGLGGSSGSITQTVILEGSNLLVAMFFSYLDCCICLFTLSLARDYHKAPKWVSWVLYRYLFRPPLCNSSSASS